MSRSEALLAPGALPRLLVRFGVACALLFFVFRAVIPAEAEGSGALLATFESGPLEVSGFLLIAFAIFGLSFAVGAVRFSLLLRAAGIDVGFASLFRALVVAGFFNLVLPGAILGDVYRVWDVRREVGEGSRTLGVVVVERLLGFAALGCVGLAAAPWIPLEGEAGTLATALLLLFLFIALANGVALHPRGQAWIRGIVIGVGGISNRLRTGFGERALRALEASEAISRSPGSVAAAFVLSLVNQGLPVLAVYVLALPLVGETPHPVWFAIIVPFVTLVSLVPISIGGTGVREGLYVLLFGAVGMAPEVALVLSLCLLATALSWALVGLLLFTLGGGGAIAHDGKFAT